MTFTALLMALAIRHTFRPKRGVTRVLCPNWGVRGMQQRVQILCDLVYTTRLCSTDIFTLRLLCYVDITSHATEYQRKKVREDFGVFLRGSRGPRSDPRRGWYGKFAGILQVDIRQRVSRVRMFMIASCEGSCGHAWCAPQRTAGRRRNTKALPRTP